jgi:hypothetical protein
MQTALDLHRNFCQEKAREDGSTQLWPFYSAMFDFFYTTKRGFDYYRIIQTATLFKRSPNGCYTYFA